MSGTPADPMKEDFKVFLYLIWHHLNLPAPTKSRQRGVISVVVPGRHDQAAFGVI
ncbi:hypothetical protein [Paracoccus sp. S4493]|uniref:hypothetical protein n=1 Tax=Paracoccus sp. S4493 TaxID=579490 RepID=UPI0012EE9120|nr:hypothetical protein [Paracoccus sp. S4493]